MHKVNASAVEGAPVTDAGARAATIKWLIGEKDGPPTFLMRQFTVEAGGYTPYHEHNWEHEIYVLEGVGKIRYGNLEEKIEPGDAILIPPGEKHQMRAGSNNLKFLCLIPKT